MNVNDIYGQTVCDIPNPNPCIEKTGPVFPGGPTLCEENYDFSVDITLPNNQLASNLTSTHFYSKDIVIQGTFYVDVPVEFYYCRVRVNPGGKIIVTSEGFLNDILAFHCEFFSCDEMWEGIILQPFSRCRFYYSEFEDAQHAITVYERSYVALNKNVFNRNFVSIRNSPSNHSLAFLLFKNNVFNCTSELSEPYDLPYSFEEFDPVSFAGILLENCSTSIGFFGSNNIFKYLNYGILLHKGSTVNIKGCIFQNAQELTEIPPVAEENPQMGSGIHGLDSDLFILGNDENTSCSFINANLFTTSSNLEVNYAYFFESEAVADGGLNGETIMIENNIFLGIQNLAGIEVTRSAASGENTHTYIQYNQIDNAATLEYPLVAIHLDGAIHEPTDHAKVYDNTINFTSPCVHSAIRHTVLMSENATIENNNISFEIEGDVDWKGTGIYQLIGLTRGVEIVGNTINGNYYEGGDPTYGIKNENVRGMTKTEGVLYCGNNTDLLSYGLSFKGDCSNSFLSQNEINQHSTGLLIEGFTGHPGKIGKQVRTLNEWLDESDNYDLYAARLSGGNQNESQFFIRTADAAYEKYYPDPTKVDPSLNWFMILNGDNNLCTELAPEPELTYFDSLILISDPEFENLPDQVKFFMEKSIINILLQNETLTIEWGDYLTDMEEESEYIIAKTETDLKKALQLDLTDQDDLDNWLEIIKSTYERIYSYDDYNYSNIDSVTFVVGTGLDSILAILDSCHNYITEQHKILQSRDNLLINDLETIYEKLKDFVPRDIYDENYKFIYLSFIKVLMGEELTSEEDSIILTIVQDDQDSSFANLLAFSLFKPCGEGPFPGGYSKVNNVMPLMEERKQKAYNEPEVIRTSIGEVINANYVNGKLEIYDMLGRLLNSWGITEIQNFSTITCYLPSGTYFWRVIDSENSGSKTGLFLSFQ